MSDLSVLENRISAALERIRAAVAAQGGGPGGDDAVVRQLDEERMANAQLEERVKMLKATQDGRITDLETRLATQTGQLEQMETELQRLRTANADLRQVMAQLRSAAVDGATDPELINRAMMAEIEALTAQHNADAAEVHAILEKLTPMIEEAAHAAG